MTVVFATNYYNHHQACLAWELDRLTNHNFCFVETMPMDRERMNLGWGMDSQPPFVIRSYEPGQAQRCRELIARADVVIWGSCPYSMIIPRLLAGKLTFQYSERIFKQGYSGIGFWGRWVKYVLLQGAFQRNHYLLCSSAYTASDYAMMGQFRGRAFRWGYFPDVLTYDLQALLAQKQPGSLLWVGRMIPYKRPELAVRTAQRLQEAGATFRLTMVGCGPLEESLRRQLREAGLEDRVVLAGAMPAEQVRREMEKAAVFLYTADRGEGWGAVLNEAMNSACACVACRTIGAVPYLVNDGENGLIYGEQAEDDLLQKTRYLLEHPREACRLGENAYRTMHSQWNAAEAARRLARLMEQLCAGEVPRLPDSGPCSAAPIIKEE